MDEALLAIYRVWSTMAMTCKLSKLLTSQPNDTVYTGDPLVASLSPSGTRRTVEKLGEGILLATRNWISIEAEMPNTGSVLFLTCVYRTNNVRMTWNRPIALASIHATPSNS